MTFDHLAATLVAAILVQGTLTSLSEVVDRATLPIDSGIDQTTPDQAVQLSLF